MHVGTRSSRLVYLILTVSSDFIADQEQLPRAPGGGGGGGGSHSFFIRRPGPTIYRSPPKYQEFLAPKNIFSNPKNTPILYLDLKKKTLKRIEMTPKH